MISRFGANITYRRALDAPALRHRAIAYIKIDGWELQSPHTVNESHVRRTMPLDQKLSTFPHRSNFSSQPLPRPTNLTRQAQRTHVTRRSCRTALLVNKGEWDAMLLYTMHVPQCGVWTADSSNFRIWWCGVTSKAFGETAYTEHTMEYTNYCGTFAHPPIPVLMVMSSTAPPTNDAVIGRHILQQ